jgi:hypothetical protein
MVTSLMSTTPLSTKNTRPMPSASMVRPLPLKVIVWTPSPRIIGSDWVRTITPSGGSTMLMT